MHWKYTKTCFQLSFESRNLLWNYRNLFFKDCPATFATTCLLESRILSYVYNFLQPKVILSEGFGTSRYNILYFTQNVFLDSKIRALWTFCRIVHSSQIKLLPFQYSRTIHGLLLEYLPHYIGRIFTKHLLSKH